MVVLLPLGIGLGVLLLLLVYLPLLRVATIHSSGTEPLMELEGKQQFGWRIIDSV